MKKCAHFIIFAGVCLFLGNVHGQLNNGMFEFFDLSRPNRFYTPYRYPPLGWQWQDTEYNKNYVALHSSFTPQSERGQVLNWQTIPAPFEGGYFVLLSTGDAQGFGTETLTRRSLISQVIQTSPGDVLYGSYFFGTTDYWHFNDTGLVKLIPPDPEDEEIIIVQVDVGMVGNFGATDSWQHFAFEFTEELHGQFNLVCEVYDIGDEIYKSYLALDNFRICRGTPMFGDFNWDCRVDFLDFEILSSVWMSDCGDLDFLENPEITCDLYIVDHRNPDIIIGTQQLLEFVNNWFQAWE